MDSKDAFLSAKIMVDFVRDFIYLAEQQLLSIRKMMESIVGEIMTSVHAISSKADDKIGTASHVLVKDPGTDRFKNASADEADEHVTANESSESKGRASLEAKLMRSGGIFSKHMEVLGTMETEVQEVLIKVVGSVSMDDVMAQRLSHVTQSIKILRRGLSKVMKDNQNFRTQENVKRFRNEILTEVYLSYTAEEEKKIFHKIFGQPKINNKVS